MRRATVQRATRIPSRFKLLPDLVRSVDAVVGLVDTLDLGFEPLVAQ
jgi:hypothetical protein